MMQTVELKTAFHWNCEECGHDNFALPITAEMSEEEREETFRKMYLLADYEDLPDLYRNFAPVMIPKVVQCSSCQYFFETKDEDVPPPDWDGE